MPSQPRVQDLSSADLAELQRASLEMAKYFRDFCQEHGLLFYLCGGCCIGAVRHKGFIPWDDDVDVFMPRDDYERFRELWPREADTVRYPLVESDEHLVNGEIFATIRDTQTTFVKTRQEGLDMPHGIVLDVIPLDGCPEGSARKKQKLWASVYSLFRSQVIPETHGGLLASGSKVLLDIIRSPHGRYKMWRKAEREMTQYRIEDCEKITELVTGPRYMQNEFPKEIFASAVMVPFEDTEMPIPVGYDTYLRTVFGDYMQLPPEDQRRPHHDVVFMDLHKPCV